MKHNEADNKKIILKESSNPKDKIQIVGDFTDPKWSVKIPLIFDNISKSFFTYIKLKSGNQFKFIVNGIYKTSSSYDLYIDKGGFLNNIITINLKQIIFKKESSNKDLNEEIYMRRMSLSENKNGKILPNKINQINKTISNFSNKNNIFCEEIESTQNTDEVHENQYCLVKNQILYRLNKNYTLEENIFFKDKPLFFNASAFIIGKNEFSCDDSFFITKHALGISDGVSGWANYGISSHLFSKNLMKRCADIILQENLFKSEAHIEDLFNDLEEESDSDSDISNLDSEFSKKKQDICPKKLLTRAFSQVKDPGSATVLLCVLNGNNCMNCLNLGDSKLMILKEENKKILKIFESKEQQHKFNTPYQLTRLPDSNKVESIFNFLTPKALRNVPIESKKKIFCSDSPEDGETYQICVNEKDILILGTDGLFDNLYDEEIIKIVEDFFLVNDKKSNLLPLATKIASIAKSRSLDSLAQCPFNDKGMKELNINLVGGKVDDITVIVSTLIE